MDDNDDNNASQPESPSAQDNKTEHNPYIHFSARSSELYAQFQRKHQRPNLTLSQPAEARLAAISTGEKTEHTAGRSASDIGSTSGSTKSRLGRNSAALESVSIDPVEEFSSDEADYTWTKVASKKWKKKRLH